MERKALLAVGLSILVLVAWQFLLFKTSPPRPVVQPEEGAPEYADSREDYSKERIVERRPKPQIPEQIQRVKLDEKLDQIETEHFTVTLSNISGCVKKIELKDYPDSKTGAPQILIDVSDPSVGILSLKNFNGVMDSDDGSYRVEKLGKHIKYTATINGRVEVVKEYFVEPTEDIITARLILNNISPVAFQSRYDIIGASSIDEAGAMGRRYIGVSADLDGKAVHGKRGIASYQKTRYDDIDTGWVALKNKYFSVIFQPSGETSGAFIGKTDDKKDIVGIKMAGINLAPNIPLEEEFTIYAGPTELDRLQRYGFEKSISLGVLGGISKVLLILLKFFFRIFRNWGVAIIVLSAFVNLALFPLTKGSYKSMQKIQELQPHIERLRNEHKSNPQKMNKETMELYKKHKVNPMGGCLPLFLQMPVFIALYQTLIRFIQLKGSKFLWIKDLSGPDAVPLPLTLPLIGNSINILPLLMVGAMFFQQKLSQRQSSAKTSPQQKQQQQIMAMMPLMFGVILYNFPSGLVLYWLTNTLLTISEQRVIARSQAKIG